MCQQRRRHPRRRAQEAATQCVGIGCLDRFAQFRCVARQDWPDQHPPSIAQRHLLLALARIPWRQPGGSRFGAHLSSPAGDSRFHHDSTGGLGSGPCGRRCGGLPRDLRVRAFGYLAAVACLGICCFCLVGVAVTIVVTACHRTMIPPPGRRNPGFRQDRCRDQRLCRCGASARIVGLAGRKGSPWALGGASRSCMR